MSGSTNFNSDNTIKNTINPFTEGKMPSPALQNTMQDKDCFKKNRSSSPGELGIYGPANMPWMKSSQKPPQNMELPKSFITPSDSTLRAMQLSIQKKGPPPPISHGGIPTTPYGVANTLKKNFDSLNKVTELGQPISQVGQDKGQLLLRRNYDVKDPRFIGLNMNNNVA